MMQKRLSQIEQMKEQTDERTTKQETSLAKKRITIFGYSFFSFQTFWLDWYRRNWTFLKDLIKYIAQYNFFSPLVLLTATVVSQMQPDHVPTIWNSSSTWIGGYTWCDIAMMLVVSGAPCKPDHVDTACNAFQGWSCFKFGGAQSQTNKREGCVTTKLSILLINLAALLT